MTISLPCFVIINNGVINNGTQIFQNSRRHLTILGDIRVTWNNIWNENQLMSLFYSYIAGSVHVSGPQAHLQESSYSCSHNHWFSFCAALFACPVCCGLSLVTILCSPEDGPVGPKHVEIQQYTNKIVTSVGFHSICWKDARYKKLKTWNKFQLIHKY